MAKINVTMDDELLGRVDNFAETNYMSRSGFISLCCVQYLNQQEALGLIQTMNETLKKIASKNQIDDETRQELENFDRICSLASGKF